ncbi:outer membrane beta-barrel protein [Sphingomonas sp.]|uniref:outer membrane beta-barrel protein n=1 Tax=Sphingomonas sp. TaxID=28214 RepID=UPI003B3A18D4
MRARLALHALPACLIAIGWCSPAAAADWVINGHGEARDDDNLFRKPGEQRQSDQIYSAGVGGLLNLNTGGLTGVVGGEINRSLFAKNDYLNNTGYILNARLSRPKGRLTFDLTASRERRLSDFSEIFSNIRNMQTFTQVDGQVRVKLVGDFRAVVGGSLMRNQNSSAFASGYNNSSASLGFGYFPPTGNYITLLYQQSRSRGLGGQEIDVDGVTQLYRQRYDERRIGATVHYQPSALLLADVRIGYLHRNDKSIFDKNFSGVIGDATITWRPRRTIEVVARAGRQLQSDGYIYSDSVRQDFVSLLARSSVTNHLKVDLLASYAKQHFVYDILSPVPIEPRTDRLRQLKAGVSYALSDRMTLRLEGRRSWRRSTNELYPFTENAGTLGIKFAFGPGAKIVR